MKLLSLGRRTATGPDLSEHQQRLVWRVTALLLDYPTAAALSVVLMAAILVIVAAYVRRAGTEELL